ncbi:MAG TPA: SIMPL domain-containing protein [Aggregatilinea sp.]|uniref:SIMPL domain-containing protein n=1 Tax=Aggregatilinea sp. TaxID=2806333 RepID=UPI002C980D26|nr:SIMPL domain-containing protein [Aggregatilinea sp.]HML22593.1 SIMPL domain-containing protein [Aggregatilinea sp.]
MSFRKHFVAALALVLTLTLAASGAGLSARPAHAQDGSDQRTVTVTGYGYATGVPDIVRVGLGVEAVNTDIADAMDDVNTRMDAVIQTLQDAGVAPEDIRTEYFNISQDYSYSPMASSSDAAGGTPYRVSTTVRVTVRDASRVGELISAAVDAGANLVNYVEFDISDSAALESEARTGAVADARARAEELAGLVGATVGEAVDVVEGSNVYPLSNRMDYGGMGAATSDAAISQGTLSVTMSVTITYVLQ